MALEHEMSICLRDSVPISFGLIGRVLVVSGCYDCLIQYHLAIRMFACNRKPEGMTYQRGTRLRWWI